MADIELTRFALALVFVLGLIGLGGWLVRRLKFGGAFMVPSDRRRLRLVEALVLDPRHKLMLIRHDEDEHLVIVGPGAPLRLGGGAGPSDPEPPEAGG